MLLSRAASRRLVTKKQFIEILFPKSLVSMKKVNLYFFATRWGHLFCIPKSRRNLYSTLKTDPRASVLLVCVLRDLRGFTWNFLTAQGSQLYQTSGFVDGFGILISKLTVILPQACLPPSTNKCFSLLSPFEGHSFEPDLGAISLLLYSEIPGAIKYMFTMNGEHM